MTFSQNTAGLLFFNFTTVRRHVVAIFMEPLQFCPWIRISTLFFWKVTVRPSDIAHMIWTGSSFTVAIKFLSKLFDSMRNESADWLLESYFIAGAKILLFLQTWKNKLSFHTICIFMTLEFASQIEEFVMKICIR